MSPIAMSNPEDRRLESPPTTEDTTSMSDRRRLRSPPAAIPIFRMLSLLIMLAVIGLTIYNLNLRGRELVAAAGQGEQAVERPLEKAAASPAKTGKPIADEDPQEFKRFRHDSEAILDKTTSIPRFELPAYWRVMDWVQSQSLADLKARSFPEVPFQELIHHPDKYRGRPVRVDLRIRSVVSFNPEDGGKGSTPKTVYELRGWPPPPKGWLYYVVTPELPPGFPIGNDVDVTTVVYGYFFKLQGYQPYDAKPNARALVAPLIMGRVAPVAVVPGPAPNSGLNGVVLLIGGVILAVAIVGWIIAARRKPIARMEPSLNWPDTMEPDAIKPDAIEPDAIEPGPPNEVEHG